MSFQVPLHRRLPIGRPGVFLHTLIFPLRFRPQPWSAVHPTRGNTFLLGLFPCTCKYKHFYTYILKASSFCFDLPYGLLLCFPRKTQELEQKDKPQDEERPQTSGLLPFPPEGHKFTSNAAGYNWGPCLILSLIQQLMCLVQLLSKIILFCFFTLMPNNKRSNMVPM